MTDSPAQTISADADDQLAVLRSFSLAGKTASEAYDHIYEAYGGEAMSAGDSLDLFNKFVSDKRKSRELFSSVLSFPSTTSVFGISLFLC